MSSHAVRPLHSPPLDDAPGVLRRARVWLGGVLAAALGLAPHVLHHAGPLAGAALLGGVGGSLLFGALGFVLAIPFLLRLHRRCGSWRVPAAVLAAMVAVFSVSTFVVGPALTSESASVPAPTSAPAQPPASDGGHAGHH